MEFFKVDSIQDAAILLGFGVAAGVMLYVLNKVVVGPVESSLFAATSTTTAA